MCVREGSRWSSLPPAQAPVAQASQPPLGVIRHTHRAARHCLEVLEVRHDVTLAGLAVFSILHCLEEVEGGVLEHTKFECILAGLAVFAVLHPVQEPQASQEGEGVEVLHTSTHPGYSLFAVRHS